MNKNSFTSFFSLFIVACCTLTAGFNTTVAYADTPANPPAGASARPIVDVLLHRGTQSVPDVLVGQVFDSNGVPMARAEVVISNQTGELATARTNDQGYFGFRGVQAGIYTLHSGQGSISCRVWKPGLEPPNAQPGIVVISGDDIVRAQFMPGRGARLMRALRNPWVIGGIVATAVAVPVAIAVADDDDDEAPGTP